MMTATARTIHVVLCITLDTNCTPRAAYSAAAQITCAMEYEQKELHPPVLGNKT